MALATVVFGFTAGKLIPRFGAGVMMRAGLGFCLACMLMVSFAHDTYLQLATAALLMGIGLGFGFAAIPTLVIASSPPQEQASNAGMVQSSYSLFSAITPVVLFVILGTYATTTNTGGLVYQSDAFTSGGLFAAGLIGVILVLGLTVLRVRRDEAVVPVDDHGADSGTAAPSESPESTVTPARDG